VRWAAEPALETTTVRLGKTPIICFAPQYVSEALLRAEGFTDIRYVDSRPQTLQEDLGVTKLISNRTWRTSTPSRSIADCRSPS
jgi:hypothetical protein